MKWDILMRHEATDGRSLLPTSILTDRPQFQHENMPDEISLLLPTNKGPGQLINDAVNQPDKYAGAMLGLFLANPFLDIPRESARLHAAGIRWITNLPSVEQQDRDFSSQLSEVNMDQGKELDGLAHFRSAGFKIAVVVAGASGAEAASAIEPEALIVLPRVADFAAGFPSARQRGAAAQAAFSAAGDAGWSGILLGLGEAREADHKRQWPDVLDGLVCRPVSV